MLLSSRNLCLLFLTLLALLPRAAEAQALDWPRIIEAPKGRVVIYQPQLETFEGNMLSARSAISATPTGEVEPSFGAAWFEARIETDRGDRTVDVTDVKVAGIRFPEATEEQRERLTELLEAHFKSSDLSISLDQFLTSLDLVEHQRTADQLENQPPSIVITAEEIQLIAIDGEPALRPEGPDGVLRVLNAPHLIYRDVTTETCYLRTSGRWYRSSELRGDYERVDPVPERVLMLAAARAKPELDKLTSGLRDAKILVATEPTELIRTFGEPVFTPIEETGLQYVSNTAGNLFLETSTNRRFLLLSGRWFSAETFAGPWTFVAADQLPADFAKIPPDSKKCDVRTFVAGTDEAREAVLDTQIPQTAVVNRETAKLRVAYDGEPKFESVEGTELQYAVNTSHSVILTGSKYYCCDDAIWFVSDGSTGPWVVCDAVPEGIYDLPPSCPVYNVKFVHAYYSTPELVYVGYTPGYVGCYVQGSTIVYGTGYPYPCSAASVWLPRPCTYGFAFGYNPITGNWGSVALVAGPYGYAGIGYVSVGCWGPAGYRSIDDDMDLDVDQQEVNNLKEEFKRQHNADRNRQTVYDRRQELAKRRDSRRPGRGERRPEEGRRTSSEGRDERASGSAHEKPGGRNNHFADKDGFVYRRNQNGMWERRTEGEWKNYTPQQNPGAGQRNSEDAGWPTNPDNTRLPNPGNAELRPDYQLRQYRKLDWQYRIRQRGEWRAYYFDSISGGF